MTEPTNDVEITDDQQKVKADRLDQERQDQLAAGHDTTDDDEEGSYLLGKDDPTI